MKSETKKDLLVVLLLLFLNFLLFYRFLLNSDSMIYPSVEAVRQEYFWKTYLTTNLLEKSILPLWDINVYSGTVYLAIPNQSMFFPLNILYLLMPVQRAIGYNIILDIFLAGIFCYALTRSLGLRRLPSTASAITYMFSGTMVSQVFGGNITQINAIVWLPLLLTFMELSIKKRKLYIAALGGFSWALMILSGHLQYPIYGIFLGGAYVLFRYLIMKDEKFTTHAKMLAILVFVGVLVSSIRLFPVLEFSGLSTRASGLTFEESSQDSMPPLQSVNMAVPDAFGNHIDRTYWGVSNYAETSIFVGLVSFLLAVFSLFFVKNKFVKIFSLMGLLSILLMFGKFTPLFGTIIGIIKPLAVFKTPVRFAFGFVLSVSVLAGFGYEQLLSRAKNNKNFSRLCFALAAVFVTVLAFMILEKSYILEKGSSIAQSKFASKASDVSDNAIYEYYYSNSRTLVENYYARMLEDVSLLFVGSFGLGMFLIYRQRKSSNKYSAFVPLVLIIVSMLAFGHKFTAVENANDIIYTPNFIDLVKDSGMGRILAPIDVLPQHIAINHGIMMVTGYSEVINDYARYLSYALGNNGTGYAADLRVSGLKNPAMLNDLGVKYFILTSRLNNSYPVFEGNTTVVNVLHRISYNKTIYIYKNDYAKPKIFLTNRFVVSQTKNLSDVLHAEENGYVVIDRNPSIEINEDLPIDYNVTIRKYEPNYIEASVYANQNSILVLGDAWYPGWYAAVDNEKVTIMKADTIIRAIELQKGSHKVSFSYKPASLSAGLLFTVSGLLTVVYLFYRKI
ncbi:MAG: YfhO family protein [Candidatus Aenigmarchaeota archaeon]|nr:YfhO family protein [Candidatus Aenigmarchaeota archaeon]